MSDRQADRETLEAGVDSERQKLDFAMNVLDAIGNTPLIRLNKVTGGQVRATVLAKAEFFNPGGSVKDRIGPAIIADAEQKGLIKPGGTIVEATSGNTGVGLALAAAVKGYKTVFVMPDKMSEEKVRFLRSFGARVVLTPTAVAPEDPRSYYNVARRIAAETHNAVLANQYHNPVNPETHYRTTGPELWRQTSGKARVFVAGLGTGGTITGAGRYLKERDPGIKIVGVDIQGSLLYDAWRLGRLPEEVQPKTYKIEGIGEDFLPSTLDLGILDEVVQVDDRESFLMARRLVREEGIFCGGSSGSAVVGLLKSEIVRSLSSEQIAVVLLPDSGNRYLSKLFDDTWMRENGFLPSSRAMDTVEKVLDSSSRRIALVTARPNDRIKAVVARMKEYGFSQLPVVSDEGKLVGIISEVDLLDHLLLDSHVHDPDETIAAIVNPNVHTVAPGASIEQVLPAFEQGKLVAVTDGEYPVGILTKIDLIDYLAGQL
ncbi:MAG TPA: cystathionine beta-synthase [Levilinea sp.]|nr:cystathionine beta-synthase [Levilinea sp.]